MERFCFAFTSSSHVSAAFAAGLVNLLRGPLTAALDGVIQIQSGPTIAHARDKLTRIYLQRSNAPILVMADCDVAFHSAHVGALLALSPQAGIVGARYSGFIDGHKILEAGHFVHGEFVPLELGESPGELVDVDVIGAGLVAIRRQVFEDVAKHGPGEPLPWWSQSIRDGGVCEEDFEFALRGREAGHRVALAARVPLGHVKMVSIA